MSNVLYKGAATAEALSNAAAEKAAALREKNVVPTLAILRVGESADNLSYERGAVKRCEKVGVEVKKIVLPHDVQQMELLDTIRQLNSDKGVHGVLMFRPLPRHLDEKAACAALSPAKDVDGITEGSMAAVYSGKGAGFAPCTAQACMEILKYYGVDPSGKRVAVIGRSLVIGRPVSMLLMAANATVTICHTKTVDMPAITREADIVVVAAGRGESIGAEYFRPGQSVIDVGINWSEEKQKLVGDVAFEQVEPIVEGISPVPGGVGSVTTAVLVNHVVRAAEMAQI